MIDMLDVADEIATIRDALCGLIPAADAGAYEAVGAITKSSLAASTLRSRRCLAIGSQRLFREARLS